MPFLWTPLLLSLLILITFLPDGYIATHGRGNKEHHGLGQTIKLAHRQKGEPSNTSDIKTVVHSTEIGAAKGDYPSFTKIVEQIKEEIRHKYKANNNMFEENPAPQNEKDEISMEEVVKILMQMSKEWKKKMNNLIKIGQKNEFLKLFQDAIMAKIAFNRFMEIFSEARDQEIIFNESMDSPRDHIERLDSLSEKTEFSRPVLKRFNSDSAKERTNKSPRPTLRRFISMNEMKTAGLSPHIDIDSLSERTGLSPQTLVTLDSFNKKSEFEKNCAHKILAIFTLANYWERNLLEKVNLSIGIVENAIKFYELKEEREHQGSEMKVMMDRQKEQMEKFEKWLKMVMLEVFEPLMKNEINEQEQDYLIADDIFLALINKNSPFKAFHDAQKKVVTEGEESSSSQNFEQQHPPPHILAPRPRRRGEDLAAALEMLEKSLIGLDG